MIIAGRPSASAAGGESRDGFALPRRRRGRQARGHRGRRRHGRGKSPGSEKGAAAPRLVLSSAAGCMPAG